MLVKSVNYCSLNEFHLYIIIGLSQCHATRVAYIDGRTVRCGGRRAAGGGGGMAYAACGTSKAGQTDGRADGQADGPNQACAILARNNNKKNVVIELGILTRGQHATWPAYILA